ncbi:hypothetical protein [Nocardia sp. NRRL S-836]|uniref:hypothetical protein n=1 Tax=Nocardia sp. NRRL S-836 TaxID=1519492 RepID=UPI0006B0275D|nr:hypothetical protein [Nocardia sp. NRRL S-836]KOV85329.1 hypothetical protein ADL03_14405 [Nocardia sp. NRRL S-836]
MATTFWAWVVSALVIVLLAVVVPRLLGAQHVLRDARGRYSLSRLQVLLWTVVLLSLVSGMAYGRFAAGQVDVAGFALPGQVLTLLSIVIGSAVAAAAIKVVKSTVRPDCVAAHPAGRGRGRFMEMLTVEEGVSAGRSIDLSKFQNFLVTVLLLLAYTAQAVAALRAVDNPAGIGGLPAFSDTLLVLLAVSHAGYLLGKIPSPVGTPPDGTMAERLAETAVVEPVVVEPAVAEPVVEPSTNGSVAVPEMWPA